jgi:hypothetical protein
VCPGVPSSSWETVASWETALHLRNGFKIFITDYFHCSVTPNDWQAMLFLNFSTGPFDSFKSAYSAAAEEFKDKEIKFLIGDIEASQGAFQV